VVSLGFDTDGKRVRKKVSGQTEAEVRDKLKELHSELDAGVRTSHGYTVEKAVADRLAEGLPGRAAKTIGANRDALRPLLAVIGTIPLKDLTVSDARHPRSLARRRVRLRTRGLPAIGLCGLVLVRHRQRCERKQVERAGASGLGLFIRSRQHAA
jgi:hypothetical protein